MHNKSVANASGVSKCLVFVEVMFLKIKPLRYLPVKPWEPLFIPTFFAKSS